VHSRSERREQRKPHVEIERAPEARKENSMIIRFETLKARLLATPKVKAEYRGHLNVADPIPASEFTRNFGRYRMLALREAVAVSSDGSITGYFVAPDEYEEFRRFKQRCRSFATAEVSDERAQTIGASRMDEQHAHLDAVLERK
jgi:hypothetical protein